MATLPLSQRRRKQPKPRHLNKDFSGLVPVDQLDAKGDVRKAIDNFGDDRCFCETCLRKFDDPESFLVHLKSCPGSPHDLRQQQQQQQQSVNARDSEGDEAEEEMSENEGFADHPEFHLYDFRRSSEAVNRYAHMGTDALDGDDDDDEDDDETTVPDSPDDNDDDVSKGANNWTGGSDDRAPSKTRSNRPKGRRSSFSPSEENEMTSRTTTEVTSQAEDCGSRLSGSDRTVPSKMLDMHQLYLVLIQLQQQQLLQLRMLDAIQKKLAENIMLTTNDLISGFPELAVPPPPPPPPPQFGVLRSLSGTQELGPNCLSMQSSDPSGEPANAPRKHQDYSASGVLWPDHRKHSRTHHQSEAEVNEAAKKTAATDELCEYASSSVAERHTNVITMTGDGTNSLQDDKSLSRNNLIQQNSSRSSLLDNSLGSEFSEAFKKGRMSMPAIPSVHLLSSDQPTNETDGRPNDNVIFRHRCRLCLKVLGSDSALQIHMRSHTGERPYKCNICGNRFTTKGNLKVHFSRHQEQYPNIKMNSDPVPEHLDQLGHPPPPGLPPPPLAQPPTTILSGHIPQSFYSPGPFLPATIAAFNKGGMNVSSSSSLVPSSTVTSAAAAGAVGTMPLPIGDSAGKVKSGNLFIQNHLALQSDAAYSETVPQTISKASTEARSLPTGTLSRVMTPGDIPNSAGGSIFPSPLTALSSMSSSLPSLKSPLNLSFPGPLAMPSSGVPLLPPFRVEPTPALLAFTRNSIPSSKEDDHLEQFMEIHLPESGKMDELVKEGGGKVSDPNECAVCHRVLSCRSALQMHYRTHTGERPYRCKLCSRTFTTKGNLKTHMSVHRGKSAAAPTVIRCPVCSRDFANALVLQQHMRMHGTEPHRHLPMHGAPMMMPVLNPLFPFPVNFPYFGPGFAPFRHQISPFGLKDQAPNEGKRQAAVEASSNQTSNDEESVKKKRRISEESDGEGRMGQQDNPEDRIEEEGDEDEERDINLDIDGDLSAFANRDNDSYASPEERPDTNDATDNNSAEENTTLDCDMTIKRLYVGKENGQRSDNSTHSANTGGRERQEEAGYQGQSPMLNSSLANYAPCSSLTDQYSSPLTALEERVNALVYPGRCFKQALQLEPRSDINNVFGRPMKSEIGDKTEEESRFALRMEHQSPSIIGPFGVGADVGNSALYGKPSVIQSPAGGFHSVGQMEMAPGGKPHVICQVCGKSFACRSALEIHLRSHTKEKPFQCQICGRAFSTKGNLKQHVLMTHSVSSDQDILMTRENTSSSSDGSQPPRSSSPPMVPMHGLGLSGLMLQQIGESSVANDGPVPANKLEHSLGLSSTPSDKKSLMRYLCNVCKKPFSSTSALEIHMRTHTGDRPFVCILCGKAFTTKGNLKVHMSTHAWNKCPSRRGRRMLMDAMPTSFKAEDAVAVFGRLVRPSTEAAHYPMLGFPDYFLPKTPGSDVAINGYRDDNSTLPVSQQTVVDASSYEMVLPRPRSNADTWNAEQKEKIKEEEEEGNNNGNRSVGQNIREQGNAVVLSEAEPTVRTPPSLARTGYVSISTPAGTVSQSSLLWPTDLSQGHQQLALNCR